MRRIKDRISKSSRILDSTPLRYFLLGAVLSAFGFLSFSALITLIGEEHYLIIGGINYVLSLAISFIAHSRLVFNQDKLKLSSFLHYAAATQLSFWLSLPSLWFLVEAVSLNPILGQLATIAWVSPIVFVYNASVTFKGKPENERRGCP